MSLAVPLGRWKCGVRLLMLRFMFLTAVLPFVGGGLTNSLMMAAAGATVALLLGTVAVNVIEAHKSRMGRVVDGIVKLPATLPQAAFHAPRDTTRLDWLNKRGKP